MTESIEHSASSLELYLGCPRRWVFERLYGFREEDTEQKSFGSERHGELQAWIDAGKMPEHILAKRMLALFAEHPYPPTPETTKAEEHFRMSIDGVRWHGYTDFRRQKVIGSRQHIVGDWKTTKDLKYALKADKKRGLLVDPDTGAVKAQPVIYATREYVEGALDVTLAWAYGQSKAPWTTRLVEVDVVRSACEDAYGVFHGKALEMNQLYQIRPKANDVPYRKGYCRAFNKPCEQSERCIRSRGVFTSDALNLDQRAPEAQEILMREFLSTMKAEFPTEGANDDEAPPPPVEEDDAPPPPPEDDAPPPPPDLEEHEAEALVAEYMAAQRTPSPAPTEVEAGFINAPEAKGKRPYATPEEAAIGEGVRVDPATLTSEVAAMSAPNYVNAPEGYEYDDKGELRLDDSNCNAGPSPKPTKTRKPRAKKADVVMNGTTYAEGAVGVDDVAQPVVDTTADDVAAMSIVAPVSLTMAELKQLIRDEIFKVVLDGCAK